MEKTVNTAPTGTFSSRAFQNQLFLLWKCLSGFPPKTSYIKGRIELNITRVRGLASLAKLLACGIVLTLSTLNHAAAQGWATSFEQARDIARKQGRPIFVDFTTSWCGVCKTMDRTVMADPAIIGRLDNFVKVKVDGDARPDLCSAYGVMAYPTFIHLDPQGRVIAKREGQMRTQEMASALDSSWQTVSASMMAIQANRKDETKVARATPATVSGRDSNLIAATNENKMLPSAATEGNHMPVSAAQERLARSAASAPKTEIASATNQNPNFGSVYAMGAGPSTERRSRFGGGASAGQPEGGLRQLAESAAKPGNIEEGDDFAGKTKSESVEKPEKTISERTDETEKAAAKAPDMVISSGKSASESTQVEAGKVESNKVAAAAAPTPSTYAPAAVPSKSVQPASASSASAVVQSRLSIVSEDELPKPMLSRSTSIPTQAMNPGASVSVVPDSAYSLAALKQNKPDVDAVKPPAKVVAIAAEKPVVKSALSEEPKSSTSEEAPKTKSTETAEKKTDSKDSAKSDKDTKAESKTESKPDTNTKTSDKASVADINRWLKDADSKLVDGHKKEARAMYSKVVENDPKNISGKSDMAFIKMVSLIVDRDSDLQRKEAYQKIREFEARYPDSEHKDYYTLIRAILAVDLDEITEAHRLLATFASRFPDSKYAKMAHDNWKSLPPVKKDSSKKSSAESSKKSSSSSSSKKSSSKS